MVFRLADGQTKRMLSSKVDATLIQKLCTNAHQKKREKNYGNHNDKLNDANENGK